MSSATLLMNNRQADVDGNLPSPTIRHIKDSIYGLIPISKVLADIIDTREFQRLRHVKQLGTTPYVWPCAIHTRFEHSLGVAFLARLMAEHLRTNQPELNITHRDVQCVEIAGLCHDLGHGPWSHVFDGHFIPKARPGWKWTHEEGSEMMLDYLLKQNNILLPEKDQKFIKALISGVASRTPDEKPFLFHIVANKTNGFDVDKLDYIHRDSHMVGDPINLSPTKLVISARVISNEICFNIKDANSVYEMYAARFRLHKMVYNHKAANAIAYMIIDGLLAADSVLKIADRVYDAGKFLHLTDNIMPFIQATDDDNLAEARAIFNRIPLRDLYRCVDYMVVKWPDVPKLDVLTPEAVREACKRTEEIVMNDRKEKGIVTPEHDKLKVDDIIIEKTTMHYGRGEENPLDTSNSTRNLIQMAICAHAQRGVYSNLMPEFFAEKLVRVYTKNPGWYGVVQAGYRDVLATIPAKEGEERFGGNAGDDIDPIDDNHDYLSRAMKSAGHSGAPTPPETEPPSTPPQSLHSRGGSFSAGSTSKTATGAGSTSKGTPKAPGSSSASSTPFGTNVFTTVPFTYAASPGKTFIGAGDTSGGSSISGGSASGGSRGRPLSGASSLPALPRQESPTPNGKKRRRKAGNADQPTPEEAEDGAVSPTNKKKRAGV